MTAKEFPTIEFKENKAIIDTALSFSKEEILNFLLEKEFPMLFIKYKIYLI